MTFDLYNRDAKLYKIESSRSMADAHFNIVAVFTTHAEEFKRLSIYAQEFLDTTLLESYVQLLREVKLTPSIGALRSGIEILLQKVLGAVEKGQPIHKVLALATKADQEIQVFRAQRRLQTRDQAIAARTAAAAKQKDAKAAAALVAETTSPPPPPRRGDRKTQERKADVRITSRFSLETPSCIENSGIV